LHTNDRDNLFAYQDAGFKYLSSSFDNDSFAILANQSFMINNWAYVQSNQTQTCLGIVLWDSPQNLFKASEAKTIFYSLFTIIGLAFIFI